MNSKVVINYRAATKNDTDLLSQILIDAAAASGVEISKTELPTHPDTYQYIAGFPNETDIGVIAQTSQGVLVGGAWIRFLPTNAHAINEPLPELTMGVLQKYQRIGIGTRLMEALDRAAFAAGIPKIALGVHQNNLPAINLYKQQNWIEDGSFEQYIMMSKNLRP